MGERNISHDVTFANQLQISYRPFDIRLQNDKSPVPPVCHNSVALFWDVAFHSYRLPQHIELD